MIESFALNENIFYFLNSFTGQSIFLDLSFIFLGEFLVFLIIIFYVLFFAKRIWADKKIEIKEFFIYFSGAFSAWVLAKIIKLLIPAERPFSALSGVNQPIIPKGEFSNLESVRELLVESAYSSFPSGHATLSFALAFSVFYYDKKIGSLFLLLALGIALGRVFVGVHFPLDVLVGGFLGFVVSFFFWRVFKKKKL